MSDKNKNRRNRLTDFFRYHRNELTGKERNSFERELQKDPFAEEAMEGFESLTQTESSNDISDLHKRLKSRLNRKNKIVIYRIAASVAVLIAIFSILIITENARTRKNIAVNNIPREPVEIVRNQPINESVSENIKAATPKPEEREKSKIQVTENIRIKTGKDNYVAEKRANTGAISGAIKDEKITEPATKPTVVSVARERRSEPSAAMVRKKAFYKFQG